MCGDRFSSSTTCSRWRHETEPGRLDQSLSCCFWKVATHPATLIKTRLRQSFKLFYTIHHRDDIPRRTDLGTLPHYRTHKHQLFGKQEGRCAGCRAAFPFRNFTLDHVVPQSKGGSDHVDNLQLLCGACNSVKGDRDHAVLIATLRERGVLPPA